MRRLFLALAFAALAPATNAHPLAPGLMQFEEQGIDLYSVLWRTSVARTPEGEVMPVLPPNCRMVGKPRIDVPGSSAFEQRFMARCAGGLAGRAISVSNLDSAAINVVVRIERLNGVALTGLVDASERVYRVQETGSAPQVVADYFELGVRHLMEGLDHLLFIAGLVMLVGGGLRLLGTVTAFTLGHSLTLGLATLGFIDVNPFLAEAGIALSLLVLATELVRPDPQAWVRRRPWDMAVAFGLLHGLGFAGALAGTGVPGDAIPAALLGFNLGIEAGQVGIIAALLLLKNNVARHFSGAGERSRSWGRQIGVYAMGSLAAFWLFERLAAVAV